MSGRVLSVLDYRRKRDDELKARLLNAVNKLRDSCIDLMRKDDLDPGSISDDERMILADAKNAIQAIRVAVEAKDGDYEDLITVADDAAARLGKAIERL